MPAPLPVGSVPARGGNWALSFSTEPCRMKSGPLGKSGELISSPGQAPNQPAMPWESQAPSLGLGFLIHDTRVWIAEKSREGVWRTVSAQACLLAVERAPGGDPGQPSPSWVWLLPQAEPHLLGPELSDLYRKGGESVLLRHGKGTQASMGAGVRRGCVGRKVVQVGWGLLGLVSNLF